ncbi:MAG: tetraacyldisaccharide 4'-kinase [Mediterranea sp.]|jgi:tetraacyldisaccharide 4'-kinase|nr:tetraacyldisaccharide 4'-kinase [Mediterranea sp.]
MEEHLVKINKWLYPVSFLYGMGAGLRNKLFDWGILRSKSFDIPIVCVGNLTVGGTGKTPHIEYLVRLLQDKYRIAVLSRGYRRKTNGYVLAGPESNARSIGDEPCQIKNKFPRISVAVDGKRVRGINNLLKPEEPGGIETILLDDAFQHRYVNPGLNILLTDYHRLFCDDTLLPAGRLRESEKGKSRAQIIIVTKCPADIKPIDFTAIAERLRLYPYQKLFFSSLQYGRLTPVFPESGITERELPSLKSAEQVLLVTGIASPAVMEEEIRKYTCRMELLSFGDHHNFGNKDIRLITEQFHKSEGEKLIITTEKDAARLAAHPAVGKELKKHIYALPVEVKILQDQEDTFNKIIIEYVGKNKRNSIFSEK